MQQPSQAAPSPNTRSFAGLLADFAAPQKKSPPACDFDGLADDVATLTYEHALRAHARYRPPADPPLTLPAEPAARPRPELPAVALPTPPGDANAPSRLFPTPSPTQSSAKRKNSSVTVRLTHDEDIQLRQRAAEAGFTVSAYLRSCAFEVEALRAQVKQTLADLRSAKSAAAPDSGWRRILPWTRKAI
jgi:hypothetical protein